MIRSDQRTWIVFSCQRALRRAAQNRLGSGEVRRDVQIHKTSLLLCDWLAILPAQACVDRQLRPQPPVVINVEIIDVLSQILVCVAVSQSARIRETQQK